MSRTGRPAWFGALPDEWSSGPIRYYFEVSLGKMLNGAKGAPDQGVLAPYLAAGSIQPEHLVLNDQKQMLFTEAELAGQYTLVENDIVVVEGGAGYGRSHLLRQSLPGWGFQNHVARLRSRGDEALPGYLLYCMKACLSSGWIEANNRTATLPSLSRDVLGSIVMPVPPPAQQAQIVAYLDHELALIDTLISEQQRLIALQAERKQALVDRSVFGLGNSFSDRQTNAIGRHNAVEPLLRRIPEEWGIQRFKAVLLRREERNADLDVPMMSLKSSGHVVPRDTDRQAPDEASLPRYLVARVDDLVVNPMWLIGGAIGVTTVDGAVSPDYRVFRTSGAHHPRYLHHLLRSRPYVDQYLLYTRAQTTFDRRVQQPDLDNLPLPVPPLREQVAIAADIDEQSTKIDVLIAETERFIELARERRAALITAAVTGQIDVREAS